MEPQDNTVINPAPQESSARIVSVQPEDNNKKLYVLLAILVGLVIIVGGYYFLTNKQEIQTVSIAPTQTPLAEPTLIQDTSQPQPDEFAEWKTYNDNENGYSIQYPPDKYIRLICPGEGFALNLKNNFEVGTLDPVLMPSCARDGRWEIEISVYGSDKATEPKSDSNYSIAKDAININGVPAIKYTHTLIQQEPGPYVSWYITVMMNKFYYFYSL